VNSVLQEKLCRSCSFCAKLDKRCEQGQNSMVLQPQTHKVLRDLTDFILNSFKSPKKRRCAPSSHIMTSPASLPECIDLVHVWPQSHFSVRNIIRIINKCVKCTVFCLFGRALAPIPFTLCSISLHQPRATSQVRLLLASVESHMLLSSIILSPSISRNLRNGLHKMLALILFVSYRSFRPRRQLDYGLFRLDSLSRLTLLQ
jgi:hypothetical protein